MRITRSFSLVVCGVAGLCLLSASGCEKKPPTGSGTKHDDHGHSHDDGHDHDHGDDHGHGAAVALGEQTVGGYTVTAIREGEARPGAEASFNVKITGGASKPAAVRVWIGLQDGKGSMKAKADAEKDGWHAHAEVPSPIPVGGKLWIEIEPEKGETVVAGFDLKL